MNTTKSMLVKIAAFIGVSLGAFAIAAVAGTLSAPATTPPNGNVDAPINVGSATQYRMGPLGIGRTPTTGTSLDVAGFAASDALVVTGGASLGSLVLKNMTTAGNYLKVGTGGAITSGKPTATINYSSSYFGSNGICASGVMTGVTIVGGGAIVNCKTITVIVN